MEPPNIRTSILVVGAGPAGLCATRALLDACFSVVCIDEQESVGGSYCHHSQCHRASGAFVFSDPTFLAPLPDPAEPADVQRYLASYASYFNIDEHLRLACRLDHLAFVARDGLWRATVYDKAAGQSWEATADHVVLCVGHPRRCTVNEDVGSQQAVHACCVTPQELLQGGLPVTVVGDGLPAMDTAQAVSLLLGGDRVRLLLSQPLPAGLTSVGTHQQQQAPVHRDGASAAAAGDHPTTTTTPAATTTFVHILGTQLLTEARRRTLSASLHPHYTLPPPGLLARAVRAPAKRRFWAHVKGKATALLRPPLRPTRVAVAARPTQPSHAPAASCNQLPDTWQHGAQGWAPQQHGQQQGEQQGGEQVQEQQLVLYAPSLADPCYLPFLDTELRRALLGAAEPLIPDSAERGAEPGGAAAASSGAGGGGGGAGGLPAGVWHVSLYRGMMHPELPGLAFVGWQAAPSATRPLLLQLQAQWLAAHLAGRLLLPVPEDMRADAAAQATWHASCLASHLASPGASLARSHEEHYMNQLLGDLRGIVQLQPATSTRAISVPVPLPAPRTPAQSHEPLAGAHPGESSVPHASPQARGMMPADGSTSARLLLRCFGRDQVHCQPADADPADPWVTPSQNPQAAHQLPSHAAQHAGGTQTGPLTPATSCPLPSLSRHYTSAQLPDALAGPVGASWQQQQQQQQQQHQGPGQHRKLQQHRPTEVSEPLPMPAVGSSSGAVSGPEDSLAVDAATTFALGMGLGLGVRRPAPTPPRPTLTARLSYSGFSNSSGLLRRISTNILSLSRSLSRPGGKQPPFPGSPSSSASLPRFGASLRRSLTSGAPLTPEQSTAAAPRVPMRASTSTSYRTGNSMTSGAPSATSPSPPRSGRLRRSLSIAGGGQPSTAGLRSPERLVLCVTSPTIAPHMSAKLRALDERYGGSGAVAAEDAGEATLGPPAEAAAQRRGLAQQQSLRCHMTFSAFDEPSDGRDPRSVLPGAAQQPSLQRPLAPEFPTPDGPAFASGHHSHSPPHSPMITSANNTIANAGGDWEAATGPSASNFTNINTHTYSRALAHGRASANLPVPQPLVVAAAALTPDRPAPFSAHHLVEAAAPGSGGNGAVAAAAAAFAAARPGAAAESPNRGPGRALQAPRSWTSHTVSAGTSFRGAGFLRTLFPIAGAGGRAGAGAAAEAAPGPSPPLSPTPLSPQRNAAAAAAAGDIPLASPPPRTPRASLTGALSRLLPNRSHAPSSSGCEATAAGNTSNAATDTPDRRFVSRVRSDILVQRYSAATRGSVPGYGPTGQSAGGRSADGRHVPFGGRSRTPRVSATGADRPVGHFQPGTISGQLRRMSESTGIDLGLLVELVSDDGSNTSPYLSPELRLRQQRTQQQQQQGPTSSLRRHQTGAPLYPLQATQEESEEGRSSGSKSSSSGSDEDGLPLSASPGPLPTLLTHVPQQLHHADHQGASEQQNEQGPQEQEHEPEEANGEQGEELLLPPASSIPGPESPAPGSSPRQQLRLPALPLRLRLRQQLQDQSPVHHQHQPLQPPSPAGSPAANVAAALVAAGASNGPGGAAAGRRATAGVLRAAFASQVGQPGSPATAAATHGSPSLPPDEVLGMAVRGPADPHPFLLAAEDAAAGIPASRLELTDAGGANWEAVVAVSGGPREVVGAAGAAAAAAVGGAERLGAAGPVGAVAEAVAAVSGTAPAASYSQSPFMTSAMGWNGPRPAPRPTVPRVGGGSEYDMIDPWGVVAKWLAEASKPEEAEGQQQQQREQEEGYHRQGQEGAIRLELALGVAEQLQGMAPMLVEGRGWSGSGVRGTGAGTAAGGGGKQQEEEEQQEWQPGMALGSLRVGPELDGGADVSAAEAAGAGFAAAGGHGVSPAARGGAGNENEGEHGLCGEFVLRTSNARMLWTSEAAGGSSAGGGGGGGAGERRTPQPPPGWLSRATSGQAGTGGGSAVLSPLGTTTHGSGAAPERVAVGHERGEPAAMDRGPSVPACELSGAAAGTDAAAGKDAGAGFQEASCEQVLRQSDQRASCVSAAAKIAAFAVPVNKGGFSLDGTRYSGGGGGGGCGDGSSGNRTGDSNPSKRSSVKGFFGLASLFTRKSHGSGNNGPEQPHKHPQLQQVQELLHQQQQQQRRRRQSCRSSFDRSSISMLDAAAMAAAVPYSDMFRRTSNGTMGPMTHGSQELGHGSSAFGRAKDGSSGSASGPGGLVGGRAAAVTSHGSGVASHAKAIGSSAAAAVTVTTLAVAAPAPGEAPADTSVVEGCLDMDLVLTLRQSYSTAAEGAGEGTRGAAIRGSRPDVRRGRSNSSGRCDAVGEEGEEEAEEEDELQRILLGQGRTAQGQVQQAQAAQQRQQQQHAPPAMRAFPAPRVSRTGAAAPAALDPTVSPFTPPRRQPQQQQQQQDASSSRMEPLLSFPPVQQQQQQQLQQLRLHPPQDHPRPELGQEAATQGDGRTSPVSPFTAQMQPRPSLQLQLRQLAGISGRSAGTTATATTAGVTISSWSPLSKLARSATWVSSDGLPTAPIKSYGSEVFPGGSGSGSGGGVAAAAGGSGGAPRSPGGYAAAGSNAPVTPKRATAQTGTLLTGSTLRFMRSEGPRRSATTQLSDDPADLASSLLGSPTITATPSPASLSARPPGRLSVGVGPTHSSLLLHPPQSRSNTAQSPFHPSARSSPRAVPTGRSIDLNAELLKAAQWSVAQREQREMYGNGGGGGTASGTASRLQVTGSEAAGPVPSSGSGGLDARPRMSYNGGGVAGEAAGEFSHSAALSSSRSAVVGGMVGGGRGVSSTAAGRSTTDSISEEQRVDALQRCGSEVWGGSLGQGQGQGRGAARSERRGPAWAVRQASQARQEQLVNQVSTWLKLALEAKAAGQPPPPLPATDQLSTANGLAQDRSNRPTFDVGTTGAGGSAAAGADGAHAMGSMSEGVFLAPGVEEWRS